MSAPTMHPDIYHLMARELSRWCADRACIVCGAIPEPRVALPSDWLDTAEVVVTLRYRCGHVVTA